ncbi:hypothetical protein [Burkholderia multivorans]|uniref:hypothetical protein n=1 Tax=Burkholderia multivorans TaxID=87883 RepID=UPI0011B1E9C6|nr:hypothetical protein [Burkholderia multivorans]
MSFQDRFFGPNRSKTRKILSCVVIALIFLKFVHHHWHGDSDPQSDQGTTASSQTNVSPANAEDSVTTTSTDASNQQARQPNPYLRDANYIATFPEGSIIMTTEAKGCASRMSALATDAAYVSLGKLDGNLSVTEAGCGYISNSDTDHIHVQWGVGNRELASYDASQFSEVDMQSIQREFDKTGDTTKLKLISSFQFIQ